MILIHHCNDTEREEAAPANIRRVARRWCETGGPTLTANMRGFVSATNVQVDQIMATPDKCASDYWEIVVEASDL